MHPQEVIIDSRDAVMAFKESIKDLPHSDYLCEEIIRDVFKLLNTPLYFNLLDYLLDMRDKYRDDFKDVDLNRLVEAARLLGLSIINQLYRMGPPEDWYPYSYKSLWNGDIILERPYYLT